MSDRRPGSLKIFFTIWFVLFAVLLAFITGLFFARFKESINEELTKRLVGNIREIQSDFDKYHKYLETIGSNLSQDSGFIIYLSSNSSVQTAKLLSSRMKSVIPQQITAFSRDGEHLASVYRDANDELQSKLNLQIGLSDEVLEALKSRATFTTSYYSGTERSNKKLELLMVSKILTKTGATAGYLEQVIVLNTAFIESLKKRLNLEVVLFNGSKQMFLTSDRDLDLLPSDFFSDSLRENRSSFVDMTFKSKQVGFFSSQLRWGERNFWMALGGSKDKAEQAIREVSTVIVIAFASLIVFLVLSSYISRKVILDPLSRLLEATYLTSQGRDNIRVPVRGPTELRELTDAFNQMSAKLAQSKKELETKIKELESANSELVDAQSKLVQTAKMASLGQLVAGVAHELNNPIGFIFSNMSHLKDYSERLIEIIREVPDNPQLHSIKEKNEFDYIVEDLPRLIRSCEDGARRTRDIVLGLRNFSRLEEAKLKQISLSEAIDDTLNLLVGETKNRIQIHKTYMPVPQIECFASQINQVLMNLLSNAAQAIEGTGEIWISLKEQIIKKESWVKITIRDSGHGIQKEDLDKIFDPFYTTKGVGKGTGLGLSISYGIIKKHGGEITVTSTPGQGTEFSITLPLSPKEL